VVLPSGVHPFSVAYPDLYPAENCCGIEQADNQRPSQRRAEDKEPSQIDKGRAQKRDKQPIAACRLDTQDAAAGRFGKANCQHGK